MAKPAVFPVGLVFLENRIDWESVQDLVLKLGSDQVIESSHITGEG